MTEQELKDKVAYLESLNDQLEAELSYVDELMRLIGFSDGLETVKETAKDIYDQNDEVDLMDYGELEE
jgi:hypothetical protein